MPASQETDLTPLYCFWQPRFWPLWIAIGALRLMIMLPFRLQLLIGRLLGRLLFAVAPKRRQIAAINLRICFPELDAKALRRLVRAHGASLGFSVFEIGLALWASDARIKELVTLEGIDNATKPLEQGHGIIILSGHFPAIELIGRLIAKSIPDTGGMYRPLKNPLIDQLLRRARTKSSSPLIPKDNVRQMIRLLRKGMPAWYASDQSYDRAGAELLPFFGEPAMTNTALTSIARAGKALVVPMFPYRLADGSGYKCIFLPALENFPSDNPGADAARVNLLLEEWIRTAPEQYYWVHRRFKNRPEPLVDVYRDI
jgi:Kdo2-lipid IVA lauroyltransferase/acyltransferase